jgi:S-sulfosulfanyl-L-cysteine sulfohydrolase
MLTRRDLLQISLAAAGLGVSSRAMAQQRLTQEDLLRFEPVGQLTLIHIADLHAQLMPIHFREPSWNIGVGEARGQPPHLTGADLLQRYGLASGSAAAHALTDQDFTALARTYGRMGGLDRVATIVKAIRAERPGRTLLLDGGDTWQGSYTSLQTRGEDMVRAMQPLSIDAMTAHWEFTYGEARVKELAARLGFPFLATNVRDTTWNEDVFPAQAIFERSGLRIGVIGQAFPYTPIANPRYLIPEWSFGIQEETLRARVTKLREDGVDLVVLLSHNGFDVDRKLAARVDGIDVILTAHTHDALPEPLRVNRTLLIASGSHGKFVSRLDLDVKNREIAGFHYRLIPIFADAIAPDPEMAALVAALRAPYEGELNRVLGRTETLLYRRGNLAGTVDDLICDALLTERDAEIALSPGFRWGTTLLPGQDIRAEDVYAQTAITYPGVYRQEFTGAFLKEILEDVADNLFNPDPYYQQGGDMVRTGGLSFTIDVTAGMGQRIADLRATRTGELIAADKSYVVAGWASVNEGVDGQPVWELVMRHIQRLQTVRVDRAPLVRVVNA